MDAPTPSQPSRLGSAGDRQPAGSLCFSGFARLSGSATSDVEAAGAQRRRRRLRRAAALLVPVAVLMVGRLMAGDPLLPSLPRMPTLLVVMLPQLLLVGALGSVVLAPMLLAGRSPHVRFRPGEIGVSFDDVVGMGAVKEEVQRTLALFLDHRGFEERMGGTPRRAVLFEGPPGTGKTYMAKAMANGAGVPYLYVSSSAFQSMYYGQTNRKIRSYFKALREAARREGGAIGFIEEIDAIAGTRAGMRSSPLALGSDETARFAVEGSVAREGIAGIVNELLVQLQSFDQPSRGERRRGMAVDLVNRLLPRARRLRRPPVVRPNVLIIGATNRAADLDPALLRPGRFDRTIHFPLPGKAARREIIDYYLARKAHDPELGEGTRREVLAGITAGYSPVMIEHLLDEALVWALRDRRMAMSWVDVEQARLTEELGLRQAVRYTDEERRRVATHEAGHAVVAHLVGRGRRLEVLSIVKRRDALGLLAHSDAEERFTRTRAELLARVEIALGGIVAEELYAGESGTGPAGDLATATRVAAQMVGAYGMEGSLVSFEAIESASTGVGLVGRVLADDAARLAVERLLNGAKQRVTQLLAANAHLVNALRDELLERDELIGEDILAVLAEAGRPAGGLRGGQDETETPEIAERRAACGHEDAGV